MCCWFFRTGFHSWLFNDKIRTGSLLWGLEITSLIKIGGREGEDCRVRGLDAVRYAMKSDAALKSHSIKFILARAYSLYIVLHSIKKQQWKLVNTGGGFHAMGWCRCPVRNSAVTTANSSKVIVDFHSLSKQKFVAATIASFQILSTSSFSNIDAM